MTADNSAGCARPAVIDRRYSCSVPRTHVPEPNKTAIHIPLTLLIRKLFANGGLHAISRPYERHPCGGFTNGDLRKHRGRAIQLGWTISESISGPSYRSSLQSDAANFRCAMAVNGAGRHSAVNGWGCDS